VFFGLLRGSKKKEMGNLFTGNLVISSLQLTHIPAHAYWKKEVFQRFHVSSIEELLNVEPSIDHTSYYNATIPAYFDKNPTMEWIYFHFRDLDATHKEDVKIMVQEAASIDAAYKMCHPRDRVGTFNWNDVVRLHTTMHTCYSSFLRAHWGQIAEL
jgi:hypothetical protein